MKLGGPVFGELTDPHAWVEAHRQCGYSAAYWPLDTPDTEWVEAARAAGIVIAEVGAWSNPLSPDPEQRREAVEVCRAHLALADEVGARCCVNIAGSRGEQWDGPHPANLTGETFDMIVETVRHIIDAVKPTRTFYALETMPWMYPDSPDSYLKLLEAVDRTQLAVHLDPVNLVCSPHRYFAGGALIRECFEKLGPHIRSCHAKDIALSSALTVHLNEVRPGLGGLDYATFLHELDKLDDVPLMLEHLATPEQYGLAAQYIRDVAQQQQLAFT